MNNDVCTVLKRSYKVRGCKCAVNNKRNIVCVCNLCESLNINKVSIWIAECFNVESLCILVNSIFKSTLFIRINKCCCNAVSRKCVFEKVICAAVDCLCSYDVIACFSKSLNCICDCSCTRSYCKSGCTTLKSCNSLLKNIFCRVCKSAVDVACIFKCKTICGVLAVVEYIRSSCVNRNCSCICYRVCRFLSYMKLKCFKV